MCSKKIREANKEKISNREKERYKRQRSTKEGIEKLRNRDRKRIANGKHAEYYRKRRKLDSVFCDRVRIRNQIHQWMRREGGKKKWQTQKYLGCSYIEFTKYLQSLYKPGMQDAKKGEIHIDHIVPKTAFNTTDEESKICWWYRNLQPLWAIENISKGNRYEEQDKIKLIERYNACNNVNFMQDYLQNYYQQQACYSVQKDVITTEMEGSKST